MPKRGALHHNAKLSDEQVKEMRRLREERPGIWSYGALSEKFNCPHSTVRDVVTYKTRYSLDK
jgi:hypothetical protein